MYMAELVREMVLAMASNRALFEGVTTKAMTTEYALKAKHLWLVESDERLSYSRTRTVLADVLDVTNPSHMDCELFRYACGCVTTRSANLVAAGLSSVLKRTGLPVTVAVSGSAFETHSTYALAVGHKARQLTLRQKPFTLRTVEPNVKSAWIFASLLATIAANPS
jgi:hexokinase